MIKEARLIVPQGAADDQSYNQLFSDISGEFGGCTITEGQGYWKAPGKVKLEVEPVFILDIAYTPSLDSDEKLFHIAQVIRVRFDQKSVYLRYGNGVVQFVEAEHAGMANGGDFDFDFTEFGTIMDAMDVMSDNSQKITARVAAFEFLFKRTEAHVLKQRMEAIIPKSLSSVLERTNG